MSSSSQRLTGRSLRLASYSKRSSTPAPTPSKKRHSDDDTYDDDDDSPGGKGKLPRASKKPRGEGAGSSSGGGGGQAKPLVIRDDTGRRAYTFDTSLRCRFCEFVQARDGLDIERAQVRGVPCALGGRGQPRSLLTPCEVKRAVQAVE